MDHALIFIRVNANSAKTSGPHRSRLTHYWRNIQSLSAVENQVPNQVDYAPRPENATVDSQGLQVAQLSQTISP